VPTFARYWIVVATAALLIAAAPALAAADGGVVARSQPTPSSIVIGFVGGFVRHDNPHHGPVRLAQTIQRSAAKDTYVQVFENRHRRSAYSTILRLLDRNHDGVLSNDEKSQARIVLFGHSWGASAVVMLARELHRVGIPVLLTVQVDSVAKFWQQDGIIPDNVAAAANFYQPHGFIRGRTQIAAADPAKTQILGNYRFDYQKTPVACDGTTWFGRAFMRDHLESECDPHVWNQIADLVRQSTEGTIGALAANPHP
jgi:pimeloyl-ACP methyl ester carboxylesterase